MHPPRSQQLQTLHAEARVEGVAYTFDQALEPVHAQTADVVFSKGILQPRTIAKMLDRIFRRRARTVPMRGQMSPKMLSARV